MLPSLLHLLFTVCSITAQIITASSATATRMTERDITVARQVSHVSFLQ